MHKHDYGWDVIRKRNERAIRAEANRKPAWSADETTGTIRMDESGRCQSSFLEMCLAEAQCSI